MLASVALHPRWRRALGAASVLSALLGSAAPVRAAADSQAHVGAARAAATRGVEAFDEKKWAEAVDLFSRAEAVVHSPVHLLFIARAQVELGRLVNAHESYMRVVTEVLPADASPIFREAQADAEREAAALKPRLPHVTIRIEGAPAHTLVVSLDRNPMPAALVGLPQPVDPGDHHLEVTAPGMEPASLDFSAVEAGSEELSLTLTPAAAPIVVASSDPGSDAGRNEPRDRDGGWMTTAGFVGLGVGVLGVGLGTYFTLDASSKQDEADSLCSVGKVPGGQSLLDSGRVEASACPLSARGEIQRLDDDAGGARTLATVSFVAGGVGLASGIVFLLMASDDAEEQAVGARPFIGARSAGVVGWF